MNGSKRFFATLGLLMALPMTGTAVAQEQIDISGWGTGNVQPVPVDPGRPWGCTGFHDRS